MNIDRTQQSMMSAQNNGTKTSPLGADTTQTFLTLLMTQLKTQDPLSPMDPKEMVTQLVQFNTLGQIMQIRELLETQQTATGAKDSALVAQGGH